MKYDSETGNVTHVSIEQHLDDISELQKKIECLTTENDLLREIIRVSDKYIDKLNGIKKDLETLNRN